MHRSRGRVESRGVDHGDAAWRQWRSCDCLSIVACVPWRAAIMAISGKRCHALAYSGCAGSLRYRSRSQDRSGQRAFQTS